MTTGGEGGMVTTNDPDLWSRMWSFKDHGKSWEAVYERRHPPGFRWVHESFGTNWRMIEMQAAIGRIQLRRMPEWTAARTRNAAVLETALKPFSGAEGIVRLPELEGEGNVHGQYKYYAYVRPEALTAGWDRDRIVAEFNARSIPCFQGSCSEVYLEKAFDGSGFRPLQRLPVARELGATSLMWLVHPTLTDAQMKKAAHGIGEILAAAAGR